MNDYNFHVRCMRPRRGEGPEEIGRMFLETCDAFSRLSPVQGGWYVLDKSKKRSLPIENIRNDTTAFVRRNISRDNGEPDLFIGYRLVFFQETVALDKRIRFEVRAGGKIGGEATFEVGNILTYPDLDAVTYPLYKAALKAMVSIWPSPWTNAYAFKVGYDKNSSASGVAPHPRSPFYIPWMSYLSAELCQGLEPPPGVMTEPMPDGGMLMIVTEDTLDPTNPEHMRRSRALAELMIERAGKS